MDREKCAVPICPNYRFSTGLCKRHHQNWLRTGTPMTRLDTARAALYQIQTGWKHAADCDAEFPGHEADEWRWCDCYRGVAKRALTDTVPRGEK